MLITCREGRCLPTDDYVLHTTLNWLVLIKANQADGMRSTAQQETSVSALMGGLYRLRRCSLDGFHDLRRETCRPREFGVP
jgi:hypothetical protein